MTRWADSLARKWCQVGLAYLPFADAATREVPMSRLLRLSLFQVSAGMALALLNGTLNRVMIVELHVPAWLVALMVAMPVLVAPARAFIGHRSDHHRSVLGWRRVPYIWFGTLIQFSGLAIMPFALIVLSGDTHATTPWLGRGAAALAFLLVGAGMHTAQTAGLALATDIAPADRRPQVVALLYVMLLLGLTGSALAFGVCLAEFTQLHLIQVVQGAAVLTLVLNVTALWKQEPRRAPSGEQPREPFARAWREFAGQRRYVRFLLTVALGTMGFTMQDILLEPFGAEVLGFSVAATARLTAWMAAGALIAYAFAARASQRGTDPHRLAALGALGGVAALSTVMFAAPLASPALFIFGVGLIGFGSGLFGVATLLVAMGFDELERNGLALGAWGAAQALAGGLGIAAGGALRDLLTLLAARGSLGPALVGPGAAYTIVYQVEILLLFVSLVALGPLARAPEPYRRRSNGPFGLVEMPS
ncbi:MAG: BCD family MFS transporter [Gammaproteobacteria bacterium]|nr:BCD family MFS transporter [Gammaproteobacteria bacterium]